MVPRQIALHGPVVLGDLLWGIEPSVNDLALVHSQRRLMVEPGLEYGSGAVPATFDLAKRPFLLPGLLLFGMTVTGGIAILLLTLHNEADEHYHKDRYTNWFRFTGTDDT